MVNLRAKVKLILISSIQVGWMIFSLVNNGNESFITFGDFALVVVFFIFMNSGVIIEYMNIGLIPSHKNFVSFGMSYQVSIFFRFMIFLKNGGVITLMNPIFFLIEPGLNNFSFLNSILTFTLLILSSMAWLVVWDICSVKSFQEVLIIPYILFMILYVSKKYTVFLDLKIEIENILGFISILFLIFVNILFFGTQRFNRNWF